MKKIIFFLLYCGSFAIEPILFNRLGSDQEINKSVIGINGNIFETTAFLSGRFGNGIHITANIGSGTNFVIYSNVPFTPEQGWTMEIWVKMSNWEVVAGAPSDGNNHWVWGSIANTPPWSFDFIYFTGSAFSWYVINADVGQDILDMTPSFSSNTWYHFAAAITSNRQYVFTNGVLAGARTLTYTHTNIAPHKLIGRQPDYGTLGWSGELDNVKVHTYFKSNFSDYKKERALHDRTQ